ncbi:MAG: hypothetical protein WBV22_02260 [Anaerolineaceae bacterium]
MPETTYLEIAARLLGISPHRLWDYREGLDGISVRTPDGYRHTYRFDELERALQHTNPPHVVAERSSALALPTAIVRPT